MTDVAEIKDRIALIQATVPGLERVYNRGPYSLNSADLPACENLTGTATYQELGDDEEQVTRIIRMRYYAAIYGSDIDGLAEQACEPIIPAVWSAFSSRSGLNDPVSGLQLEGVQSARIVSDSGVVVLKHPSIQPGLWGVEFQLQVIYYKYRTDVD